MSITELSQLITAVAASIAAVTSAAGVVLSIRNSRQIREVHDATNGMKKELVNEVRAASLAAGRKEVIDEQAHDRESNQ